MFKVIYTEEFEFWLKELEEKEQDSILKLVTQLKLKGYMLLEPYSKKIEGSKNKLRELRCTRFNNRVYYFLHGERIYICLLGGNKKTQKKDIKQADKIAKEIKESENE